MHEELRELPDSNASHEIDGAISHGESIQLALARAVGKLEVSIGYKFVNADYLTDALCTARDSDCKQRWRLQELGGAVFNLITMFLLHKNYPGGDEQFLSLGRNEFSKKEYMALFADSFGLPEIHDQISGSKRDDSITRMSARKLFCGFAGAVFRDGGFGITYKLFSDFLQGYISRWVQNNPFADLHLLHDESPDEQVCKISNDFSKLEEKLGYDFRNKALLAQAMTSSACNYSFSYEVLECLGDQVLNCIVTDILIQSTFGSRINFARARVGLVSNKHLRKVNVNSGLDSLIRDIGPSHPDIDRPKEYADFVESILGAAFIDGGYVAAHRCASSLRICDSRIISSVASPS